MIVTGKKQHRVDLSDFRIAVILPEDHILSRVIPGRRPGAAGFTEYADEERIRPVQRPQP